MKRLLVLVTFTSLAWAKPGKHADVFNAFEEDAKGILRGVNPNGLPQDEVSRQTRYHREWKAYNKMINLYLADHAKFVVLPPLAFEPTEFDDPKNPTEAEKENFKQEKAAHDAQVEAMKNARDAITDLNPLKRLEEIVKQSADNAAAVFKKRNPNATAVQIEARRKEAAEQYRQQFSMLYRRAMLDIAKQIKFGDLHKLKKAFSGTANSREDFEAIIEERKAFSYDATLQLYDQMVTEESGDQPVFPKNLSTKDRASMQELWDSVVAAKQAEEARINKK